MVFFLFCFHYLKQAVGILVTQVNVDHLQQGSDFVIAHLIVVVLVGSTQVSMDPGETQETVKEAARSGDHAGDQPADNREFCNVIVVCGNFKMLPGIEHTF